jgi:hypothetical protein
MMGRRAGTAGRAILALALASAALGCRGEISIDAWEALEPIGIDGLRELHVDVRSGRIEVEPGELDAVTVSVHRRATGRGTARAKERLAQVRLDVERSPDGVLRLAAHGPEDGRWDADVAARVPAWLALVAEVGTGSIRIGRLSGSVRASSARGDVEIEPFPASGSRIEGLAEAGSVVCRIPPFLSAHYFLRAEDGALRADAAPFRIPAGATSFSVTTGREPTSIHLRARGGDVRIEGM